MSAEKAIYALLSGNTALTALVPAARIYPARLPQNPVLPSISYFRVDGPCVFSMTGPSGYAMPRIQVSIYAKEYADVKNIRDKVKDALSGYRGTIGGVNVQGIIFLGDQDVGIDQDSLLVTEQHHLAMDFRVHHNE